VIAPCVLGIDPGFAALGLALVELEQEGERVRRLEVVTTEPSARKLEVRASDDNLRRTCELAAALEERIGPEVIALAVEAQSWPRNAGSSVKVALAWGALAAVAQRHGLPVLQASPQEVKRAIAGAKTASKAEVQTALELRYAEMPDWPARRDQVEHAADALAAAVACLDHAVVKLARRMLGAGRDAA